ncbi:MAG: double zinc ribbon domain-containing protein [Holosporales bacterium]|jgi:predicted amidophosphoribosyltransferase|nr:double zinc ribbon domain-containing protein [Holosporales bacterium]
MAFLKLSNSSLSILFWASKLKEVVFPPVCAFCHAQTEDYYAICPKCWFSIKFVNSNVCDYCGRLLLPGMLGMPRRPGMPGVSRKLEKVETLKKIENLETSEKLEKLEKSEALETLENSSNYTLPKCCPDCSLLASAERSVRVTASIIYDDFSRMFILRLKDRNAPHLALVLSKFFHAHDFDGLDYISPVPIHPRRLLARTYNQSALLALGVKYWHPECPDVNLRLLVRQRHTPKQKGKDAESRAVNVQDSIVVPQRMRHLVEGKRIAVLDDVVASGATIGVCKAALEQAGAREVRCIALAKTM